MNSQINIEDIPDEIVKDLIKKKEIVWEDKNNSTLYIIKIPKNINIDKITDDDISIEEIIELPIALKRYNRVDIASTFYVVSYISYINRKHDTISCNRTNFNKWK